MVEANELLRKKNQELESETVKNDAELKNSRLSDRYVSAQLKTLQEKLDDTKQLAGAIRAVNQIDWSADMYSDVKFSNATRFVLQTSMDIPAPFEVMLKFSNPALRLSVFAAPNLDCKTLFSPGQEVAIYSCSAYSRPEPTFWSARETMTMAVFGNAPIRVKNVAFRLPK